jgi:outer membrane protein assembly factor BamB
MSAAVQLGCAALVLLAGCADDAARETGGDATNAGDGLEALRAIGYVDLDEGPAGERRGVTVHDAARVAPGYVVHADEVDTVLVRDPDGAVVHRWTIPGRDQVELGTPLADGRCLAVSVDQGLTLVDRDSRVLWTLDGNTHHEAAALAADHGGGFATLVWEEHGHRGRRVRFDRVLLVSAAGEIERSWSTHEHREQLHALHTPQALDRPREPGEPDTTYDYYHLNAVHELPDTALGRADARFRAGNLLVGARNVGLFFVLDRETLELVWHLAPDVDFPHTPSLTPAGTLLAFDNGWHRGWSRLVELDPRTGELRWTWSALAGAEFFTKRRGSCQRLANGNTLVCESARGRLFELAPDGDVVWEFWNPDVVDGRRRRIYRARKFTRVELPFLEGAR